MSKKYIIEFGIGVWLSDGEGDPPRTKIRDFAKRYPSRGSALRSLAYYVDKNDHRDWSKACVVLFN